VNDGYDQEHNVESLYLTALTMEWRGGEVPQKGEVSQKRGGFFVFFFSQKRGGFEAFCVFWDENFSLLDRLSTSRAGENPSIGAF